MSTGPLATNPDLPEADTGTPPATEGGRSSMTATMLPETQRAFSPPPRGFQQRIDALKRANTIRTLRARMKVDIKAGEVSAIDVLARPSQEVLTMKVFDLLLTVPGVGRVKVNKMLNTARVSPSKTLGGMTDRQAAELVFLLARRGSGA